MLNRSLLSATVLLLIEAALGISSLAEHLQIQPYWLVAAIMSGMSAGLLALYSDQARHNAWLDEKLNYHVASFRFNAGGSGGREWFESWHGIRGHVAERIADDPRGRVANDIEGLGWIFFSGSVFLLLLALV